MMDTLTKELYEEVTNLLHDMGTPAHIKGHYYLRSAILEVYAHPELLKNMMNEGHAGFQDVFLFGIFLYGKGGGIVAFGCS